MAEFFEVVLTSEAEKMLRRIYRKFGRRTYEILRDLITDLEFDPDKKGQLLGRTLHGFYSLHYNRFRVVYRIRNAVAEVLVVGAGWHESGSRSDVYKLVARLIESGKLQIDDD